MEEFNFNDFRKDCIWRIKDNNTCKATGDECLTNYHCPPFAFAEEMITKIVESNMTHFFKNDIKPGSEGGPTMQ